MAGFVAASGVELDVDALHAETAGLPLLLVEAVRAGRSDALSVPMRDLLAARLESVSEETGQVLAALAVCGGAADPALLRTTSGRGELETVDAVEEALRAGLVREEGTGLAFTHDALRRVAHDQLSLARRRLLHGRAAEALAAGPDAAVRAGAVARHWHEAGPDDAAAAWAGPAAVRAGGLFAHEEALLHLEFATALGGDRGDGALRGGDALVALGRYEPALVAFELAAAVAPGSDPGLRARIERRCAEVHSRVGDWDLADAALVAAAELLDAAASGDGGRPDDRLRSQVLADRAVVAMRAGRPDADRHVAAALAVAGGDVAYVHDVAGLVALAAGDAAGARDAFVAALEADPDLVLRAAVLNNLARAQAAAGALDAAVASARAALELGEAHGDRHRLAALHANLADRLHDTGAVEEAIEHLKASAALFAEIGTDPLARPDVWTLTAW